MAQLTTPGGSVPLHRARECGDSPSASPGMSGPATTLCTSRNGVRCSSRWLPPSSLGKRGLSSEPWRGPKRVFGWRSSTQIVPESAERSLQGSLCAQRRCVAILERPYGLPTQPSWMRFVWLDTRSSSSASASRACGTSYSQACPSRRSVLSVASQFLLASAFSPHDESSDAPPKRGVLSALGCSTACYGRDDGRLLLVGVIGLISVPLPNGERAASGQAKRLSRSRPSAASIHTGRYGSSLSVSHA